MPQGKKAAFAAAKTLNCYNYCCCYALIILNIIIMIILKHVSQTCASSLSYTAELTTRLKFSCAQMRIPESHPCPCMLSVPPGDIKHTIASLSAAMLGTSRGNGGGKRQHAAA